MRLFVALTLPEEAQEALSALQVRLPVGRPVPEAQLHLTLAFLGAQPEAVAEACHDALDTLRADAIALRLAEPALFGGAHGRALALSARGDRLTEIARGAHPAAGPPFAAGGARPAGATGDPSMPPGLRGGGSPTGARIRNSAPTQPPGAALRDLAERVRARLAGAGVAPERRRFRPHVTLARLRARQDPAPAIATLSGVTLGPFGCHAMALKCSHLSPDGAEHETLALYPLASAIR